MLFLSAVLSLSPFAAGTPVLHPLVSLQEPDLRRISGDQEKLADQLRRLDALFARLQTRFQEEGNTDQADLLRKARERLSNQEGLDLAVLIESIARDLAEHRTGPALEAQAELVTALEQLLADLLERQLEQQFAGQLDELEQKAQSLRDAAMEQRRLLEQAERLKKELESSEAELSSEERRALAELAQEQAELGESLQQEELASPETETAEQASEKAEDALQEASESTAPQEEALENLEEAMEAQQEALEALEQGAEMAEQQPQQHRAQERQEAILNVIQEAEALLERHLATLEDMRLFEEEFRDAIRVPRSARGRLRSLSELQGSLSRDADQLMAAIQAGGADATPYLLRSIVSDHDYLSRSLGSPKYHCRDLEIATGEDVSRSWLELIEALQMEAERERKKSEGDSGESGSQGNGRQPLVKFAEELQLLKRLQSRHLQRLAGFSNRRRALAAAGFEFDQDDLNELDRLLARQQELRQVYESILARLEESSQSAEPNAPDQEEDGGVF